MGLPDLYPAQVGSPYTTLAAPYTTGEATMTVVDATKLPDAPNIVCLAGAVAGEFRYSGKDGNILQGVTALPGTPAATTWPAGTFAFRGISAYDHASIVEHLTYQRSHIVEASLDLTTNHTYSGRVLEGAEAGENLAFGDLAVLAESGKFVKANPATLATLDGTIALVVSDTIAAGSQGMFLLRGLIRNDSWTFSPGKELYAGSGTLTHEPPTTGTQIIRKVGTALTATIIEFNPSSTLHAEYLVSVLPVNTISKDNGDVERKFWKDDFSVDSLGGYEVIDGSVEYVTDHIKVYNNTYFYPIKFKNSAGYGVRAHIKQPGVSGTMVNGFNQIQFMFGGDIPSQFPVSEDYTKRIGVALYNGGPDTDSLYMGIVTLNSPVIWTRIKQFPSSQDYFDSLAAGYTLEVSIDKNGYMIISIPEYGYTWTTSAPVKLSEMSTFRILTYNLKTPIEIYRLSVTPSISYADDFTTDTSERYQAVTGTVAYDDANKRMNVTTATGANGKASGRLKSYKFCEGAQQFDVTLPVGADGDFICMVTHATDPAMTNGIGVGLQSDGAGNWNLVTLSGTTVTEGADSGLDDGDVARIEIEKDDKGCYWYYIYDASGVKPTTPTGKLFTTLSEGYTGWYANGNSKTYAIDNISIRAESIVGRTNVEVTEPFWLRDEFSEDSLGRWLGPKTSVTISDGKLLWGNSSTYMYFPLARFKEQTISFTWTPTSASEESGRYRIAVGFCEAYPKTELFSDSGNKYILYFIADTSSLALYKNGVSYKTNYGLTGITLGGTYNITITKSGGTFNITVNDKTFSFIDDSGTPIIESSYVALMCPNVGTIPHEITNLEISGTRVYNKPIHRGAMLETYHDGTQEITGTQLVYDFQWDRRDEVTALLGTYTWDVTNGRLVITSGPSDFTLMKFNGLKFGDQYAEITMTIGTNVGSTLYYVFNWDGEISGNGPRNCYIILVTTSTFQIRRVENGTSTTITSVASGLTAGDMFTIRMLKVGTTIQAMLYDANGILKQTISATDSTYSTGYSGLHAYAINQYIHKVLIIGKELHSSNGIAACIPPIGGGARYGVEESVYIPITPGTEIPVGSVVISPNAKSTVVGTALTTFAQTPAGVSASLEYATGTKTCPGLSAAFAPTGRHRVKADRNTLTNIGVKGSAAGTSPAVYIDSLHVRKQEVVA